MCERLDELTTYFRKVCNCESDDEKRYWVTQLGKRMYIPDMEDNHLFNVLHYIRRRVHQFIAGKEPNAMKRGAAYLQWRQIAPKCVPQFALRLPNLEKEAKKRDFLDWERHTQPHKKEKE